MRHKPTVKRRDAIRVAPGRSRFASVKIVSLGLVVCFLFLIAHNTRLVADEPKLTAAFGEVDITPKLDEDHPVWLAGYGPGRKATAIHDPIMARCAVLRSGDRTMALVSVDLVGFQYPDVLRVRAKLPNVDYVHISSTHNHEGPDVIGIWGPTLAQRGVDEDYITTTIAAIAKMVEDALPKLRPVRARFGTASDPQLVRDSRKPLVKDSVLRLLTFHSIDRSDDASLVGAIVQWNCHPEAMGSKNLKVTADFVGVTVPRLVSRWKAPVVLFSGAVGGLMAPPSSWGDYRREQSNTRWDYMTAYGNAVADLADKAIRQTQAITLGPFQQFTLKVAVPIENPYYRTARQLGVLKRDVCVWSGDPQKTDEKPSVLNQLRARALITEVGWLRLGELAICCVPGEIYPELVYGQFQEPVEPNVDFPDAAREPTVAGIVGEQQKWMLLGLCNDEIGYLIPRSQWDQKAPFAYGRTRSQYGEINSCTSKAAPIIMSSLERAWKALE